MDVFICSKHEKKISIQGVIGLCWSSRFVGIGCSCSPFPDAVELMLTLAELVVCVSISFLVLYVWGGS